MTSGTFDREGWWAVPKALRLGAVAYGGKAVIRTAVSFGGKPTPVTYGGKPACSAGSSSELLAASPLLSTRGTPPGDARGLANATKIASCLRRETLIGALVSPRTLCGSPTIAPQLFVALIFAIRRWGKI